MTAQASGSSPLPSPQDMLAWAEFYAFKMKWVIIPIHRWTGQYSPSGHKICSCELTGKRWNNCNPDKPGKHPWQGWKQTPMETPEQGYAAWRKVFDEYGARNGVNIGVRTGPQSNIFAVDLDVGGVKNGVRDFEEWAQKNDLTWDEAATLSAQTGGGGFHLLYPYPAGVQKISTVAPHAKLGPSVDVKGDGGYILVAPSVHHQGTVYAWRQTPCAEALLPAPKKLVDTVEKKSGSLNNIDTSYTPTLEELKDHADELSRKKSKRSSEIGRNMLDALDGKAIAEDGGAHDAYRDVMYMIAKKWPTCDASEVLEHFHDSVSARFANKADASTDMSNLLDSMVTAISKANTEAKQWSGRIAITEQGQPLPTDTNLALFFENHAAWQGVFGYNERTNRPVYLRKPPFDTDFKEFNLTRDKTGIALWFQDKAKMFGRLTQNDVQSALVNVAHKNKFDPLQQEILKLRGTWDGVPRLETVFQRVAGTPDDAWARTVGPLWFKSLVARILWPGCKCDTMLILEGPQGYKKSSFFQALLPDSVFFSDSLSRVKHDVETVRLIHSGPAIFEIGELSGLKKQEVEEIKAFLSASKDELRPLFEAYRTTHRRCVFVGTTNRDDYLRDETGGRRFWPLKVLRPIDISLTYEERGQWFAEALQRVEAGERWYLAGDNENGLAAVEQDARFEEDIWFQTVAEYLSPEKAKKPAENTEKASNATQQMADMLNKKLAGDFVTVVQVAENALNIQLEHAKGAEGARINKILRRLGWIPDREYFGKTRVRGWRRPRDA